MAKRIFISTCEFSGDMHGERLIQALKRQLPEVYVYGVGGSRMAAAGMEIVYDPTRGSTLGFSEALKNFRRLQRLVREIAAKWDQTPPDLMIWLDSGGFNLVLAKEAKKRDIPVVCMFSPSAWAYWESRAVKLAERVRLLLAVLPFEADFYRKFGTEVRYVGHPLLDRVRPAISARAYRNNLGLKPEQKLLAILPGSRRQEVGQLLPIMLEAVSGFDDERIQVVLPAAASIDRQWLNSLVTTASIPVQVVDGGVYDLLAAADAAVIASGTATLEAAILNTPMVICYRVSRLSYFIYRRLESPERKLRPWVGLPNLIAGRKIIPEVLQEDLTPENVRQALHPLLYDRLENARIRQELADVRLKLGPGQVMAAAAAVISELL